MRGLTGAGLCSCDVPVGDIGSDRVERIAGFVGCPLADVDGEWFADPCDPVPGYAWVTMALEGRGVCGTKYAGAVRGEVHARAECFAVAEALTRCEACGGFLGSHNIGFPCGG